MNRNIAELSRFILSSPRFRFYPLPLLLLLGIDFLILRNLLDIIAVVSSFLGGIGLDLVIMRANRTFFPLRRTVFLNFFVLLAWSLLFYLFSLVGILLTWTFPFLLLFVSGTSMVRAITLYPYFSEKTYMQLVPSFNSAIPFAIAYFYLAPSSSLLTRFILASILFSASGIFFTWFTAIPFTRTFNEKPVRALNFVLNFRSSASSREVGNKLFENLYSKEKAVPVKILDVFNMDGTRKVALLFPYIHPGPFGNYGSSNLPVKLSGRMPELGGRLMVFHTATTNSNNCRGDDDVQTVADAFNRAIAAEVPVRSISRYRRFTIAGHTVGILRFDDSVLISFVPERRHFDDVSLEEALNMEAKLSNMGISETISVDGQNHFRDRAHALTDLHRFVPGIQREFSRSSLRFPAEIGFGSSVASSPGLGPMGIKAVTIKTGDRLSTIVLTDSNNILTEVINEVRERVSDKIETLEIFTTDNHFVNESNLDMNPLGKRDDRKLILDRITEAIDASIDDAGPVEIRFGRDNAVVHMGDEALFNTLQETIFISLRRAKRSIVSISLIALAASFAIFAFI